MRLFLFFLLFLFSYFSNANILTLAEKSFIEISQIIILLGGFLIHLTSNKLFSKLSSTYIFRIRLLVFIFLIYEEISFFTKDSFPILQSFSTQQELNFHNLEFLQKTLFNIRYPFTDYLGSITVAVFIYSIMLFIIGFGLFLPYLRRFRYLFLEKQYSIFSFVFILNIAITVVMRELTNFSFLDLKENYLLHNEYIELFIYTLFLADVIRKKKLMKKTINMQY